MRAMTIYHMIFWLCVVECARGSAIKFGKLTVNNGVLMY
ncbi:hypothetical protein THF5H11_100108 [Vibrio jasicida]|uniref:DUF3265 domain-containing protein n=1 Tax=Vibrio jasicida TaxID=766224 RepID=A0AAU9QNW2_9VIBR|nr:hypothetical protein THF5H11_100108 [Vibrio jasicida]CAH1578010.1 hypothetical protein THF1C08_200005 [Vibrio jasicida]CAH1589914.1 hypothetical protein THF1A12_210107 [Vibrio jasicida]CAH1604880.1 hypothetical protein THF5G08_100101 [Vibrio jasicida]